uniref:Uncharacterized protein n=1 Tax=Rhizophora mucronata TaxID=61149 RepID=A0A2P2MEV5_RHIMU
MLELQTLHNFFPNLKHLDLTFNNLQGTSFGSYYLNNLEQLLLDYSTVDDNFLQSIRALVSLQILSMQQLNAFQLTQGWPHLKSLKKLDLYETTTLNYRML